MEDITHLKEGSSSGGLVRGEPAGMPTALCGLELVGQVLCGLAPVAEPGHSLARSGLVTAAASNVYARSRTWPT